MTEEVLQRAPTHLAVTMILSSDLSANATKFRLSPGFGLKFAQLDIRLARPEDCRSQTTTLPSKPAERRTFSFLLKHVEFIEGMER